MSPPAGPPAAGRGVLLAPAAKGPMSCAAALPDALVAEYPPRVESALASWLEGAPGPEAATVAMWEGHMASLALLGVSCGLQLDVRGFGGGHAAIRRIVPLQLLVAAAGQSPVRPRWMVDGLVAASHAAVVAGAAGAPASLSLPSTAPERPAAPPRPGEGVVDEETGLLVCDCGRGRYAFRRVRAGGSEDPVLGSVWLCTGCGLAPRYWLRHCAGAVPPSVVKGSGGARTGTRALLGEPGFLVGHAPAPGPDGVFCWARAGR